MASSNQYLPITWTSDNNEEMVIRGTTEFNSLCSDIYLSYVTSIKRLQNKNRYYMFLVRQQQLKQLFQGTQYYVVRRYVTISKKKLQAALKYNLDSRRTSVTYDFNKTPNLSMNYILVVLMITTNVDANKLIPTRDSDFYIEYIIKL